MITDAEKRILNYIYQQGSITRFECEAVDLPIYNFLDCVAALKFKGLIGTREEDRKSESGRDMKINIYYMKSFLRKKHAKHNQF